MLGRYTILALAGAAACCATFPSQAQIGPYRGGSTLSYCSASDTAQTPAGEGPWISADGQTGASVAVSWGGDGWNKWHFRWGLPGRPEQAFEYGGDTKGTRIDVSGFCQPVVLKISGCVKHVIGHDRCSPFQEASFKTGPQRPSGPDTCAQGFVWREAFPNDHACVVPAQRAQAAADNARRQLAPCPAGLVPRNAIANDRICVAQAVADDVKADNMQVCRRLVRCP